MTEELIIQGCLQKDANAFKALYNKFGGILYGMALRYASTNKEAEDILQDTFVKVFQNIDSYSNTGSFIGWVKRILINTAINSYRSAYNRNEIVDDEPVPFSRYDESDVFENFAAEDLLNLLNQLPEGYRVVFNMYVIEGYKHKEIAEILNISEGTSKSQLSKAKAMLQKMVVKAGIEVLQA